MVSVDNGHFHFHGTPVQIISEVSIAITALFADAPEAVRPSIREITNRCIGGATTDDAIKAFLHDPKAYAQGVMKDTELFSMLHVLRNIQEGMEALREQQEDDE